MLSNEHDHWKELLVPHTVGRLRVVPHFFSGIVEWESTRAPRAKSSRLVTLLEVIFARARVLSLRKMRDYSYVVYTAGNLCVCLSSGLDDARNTARLAWRMISDGCIIQITKTIDGVCI